MIKTMTTRTIIPIDIPAIAPEERPFSDVGKPDPVPPALDEMEELLEPVSALVDDVATEDDVTIKDDVMTELLYNEPVLLEGKTELDEMDELLALEDTEEPELELDDTGMLNCHRLTNDSPLSSSKVTTNKSPF